MATFEYKQEGTIVRAIHRAKIRDAIQALERTCKPISDAERVEGPELGQSERYEFLLYAAELIEDVRAALDPVPVARARLEADKERILLCQHEESEGYAYGPTAERGHCHFCGGSGEVSSMTFEGDQQVAIGVPCPDCQPVKAEG